MRLQAFWIYINQRPSTAEWTRYLSSLHTNSLASFPPSWAPPSTMSDIGNVIEACGQEGKQPLKERFRKPSVLQISMR
jgi:hypothetical protein